MSRVPEETQGVAEMAAQASANVDEGIVLEHMSEGVVSELRYEQQSSEMLKPQGLWLSYPGKWAEFNGLYSSLETNGMYSKDWVGQMRLDPKQIDRLPWSEHGADRVALLDLSDRGELEAFITKFKREGYSYQVDWSRVSRCYGGIFIIGAAELYRTKPAYYKEFNHSDGCWILSIDVDSACLWDPRAMRDWLTQRAIIRG
jgi:hypothetical protein